MQRIISIWLPSFATDRLRRRSGRHPDTPLATVSPVQGGMRVTATSPAARAGGIAPGMPLADARALLPELETRETDRTAEVRALDGLAQSCKRYTPWTAVDPVAGAPGGGGIRLDVTGCAHLLDGEAALLEDLLSRLEKSGYRARAALARTPGAAWALARFAAPPAGKSVIVPPGGKLAERLAPLPVAALRIAPGVVEGLERVGLRRIGDLLDLARAPLTARFGEALLGRLDQALGRVAEPISPGAQPHRAHARLAFAEPIGRTDDIRAGLARLLRDLCRELREARLGARQVELVVHRVDDSTGHLRIGTARPARDADHLARLFEDKLEGLDPGFGVEVMTLLASRTEPMGPVQGELAGGREADAEEASRLLDRLVGRLGPRNVARLAPHASHLPERASREQPAGAQPKAGDWRSPKNKPPRPLRLLPQPVPIQVMAPVPDGPPVLFRWQRTQYRVAAAEGPERIAPEWWETEGRPLSPEVRDYYRIEAESGGRYWVYREGLYRPDRPPAWYLHGVFP